MARSFSASISQFAARARQNPRLVVKKVVIDAGTSVAMKTPVGDPDTWAGPAPAGYVGGRARGSWQYAQGAPLEQEPGTIDESGQVAIARVTAGVAQGDPATEHFITSTVPYMRPLEYEGHSRQAPDGMVRKTVEEFQQHIDNAVREVTNGRR